MNMSNLNFNLLKALDALLQEQNVSQAGAKIGITQSAMSIALKQLRGIYQDELLVRGQKGHMSLTSFAKQLIHPVREALQAIDTVFLGKLPFDPTISNRIFRIGMSDYLALVLLPPLLRITSKLAPDIKIVQYAVNYLNSLEPFDELDLVIGDFPYAPSSLKTTSIFIDKAIIVADKKHPAFHEKLTLKKFVQYPQVFVAIEGQPEENFIAKMIQAKGYDLKIKLMTPHTLIALQVLPNTLLMTNTVERLAQPFVKSLGLAMQQPPYDLRSYHARLYWHLRDDGDAANQWLRNLIKEIV
jgi:DNA-binding transcriptional LysR family regulator